MTLVLGIDPSSKKVAAVCGSDRTRSLVVQSYPLTKKKTDAYTPDTCLAALHAIEDLSQRLRPLATGDEAKLAFIESPLVGRGGVRTTMVQSFPNGVLQAILRREGWEVTIVNVSTWKSQVCGNGSATKDDVARVVRVQMPKVAALVGSDGDLCDAAGIYAYGIAVAGRRDAILAGRGL